MLTRDERLEKALASIKPEPAGASVTVAPSGAVSQINIFNDVVYFSAEPPAAYDGRQTTITPIRDLDELAQTLAALESATAGQRVYTESVWRRVMRRFLVPPDEPLPRDKIDEARAYLLDRIRLARKTGADYLMESLSTLGIDLAKNSFSV